MARGRESAPAASLNMVLVHRSTRNRNALQSHHDGCSAGCLRNTGHEGLGRIVISRLVRRWRPAGDYVRHRSSQNPRLPTTTHDYPRLPTTPGFNLIKKKRKEDGVHLVGRELDQLCGRIPGASYSAVGPFQRTNWLTPSMVSAFPLSLSLSLSLPIPFSPSSPSPRSPPFIATIAGRLCV